MNTTPNKDGNQRRGGGYPAPIPAGTKVLNLKTIKGEFWHTPSYPHSLASTKRCPPSNCAGSKHNVLSDVLSLERTRTMKHPMRWLPPHSLTPQLSAPTKLQFADLRCFLRLKSRQTIVTQKHGKVSSRMPLLAYM